MKKSIFGLLVITTLLLGFAAPSVNYSGIGDKHTLTFPRDHFAHENFRTEWWYFNGFLGAEGTHQYAFHLAFFVRRTEVDFLNDWLPIRWFSNPVHLAHFSLLDLNSGEVITAEKRTRDHQHMFGAAGASQSEARVWNENWQYFEQDQTIHLQVSELDFDLSLSLRDTQGPILHGDHGSFVKARYHGQPRGSYYVSRPRLEGSGQLSLKDTVLELESEVWMDHEFGSFHLAPDQLGWDWFSLMLQDGSELTLYMLKNSDGSISEFSKGTWIDPNGQISRLNKPDLSISPEQSWRSQSSKADYPTRWNITIPKLELTLQTEAYFENLEFDSNQSTLVTYWEGPVSVQGMRRGKAVTGFGFQELTGNAAPLTQLFE